MSKIVVIVNGKGGYGKDTLISYVCMKINALNVTSIDPIKKIAVVGGWDGTKDSKGRALLSNLKKVFIEYNNLPYNYLMDQYHQFESDNNDVLFVQIRESSEISKFKESVKLKCYTILVTKTENEYTGKVWFNNTSDDLVDNYNYDFYFKNDIEIQEAKSNFFALISSLLANNSPTT